MNQLKTKPGQRIRKRRDKSTKFFEVIQTEQVDEKRWKKTDKWREPWF
jgi:hypothetical protein